MYCMHCGSRTAENAQYCIACGKQLSPNLSQPEGNAFAQHPMASPPVKPINPVQEAAMPTSSLQIKSPGAWMIIGGGVLCLLAFFCMPYVTIPILGGTMSGVQLAGFQPDSSVTWLQALWLQPLLALVITICTIPAAVKDQNKSTSLGTFVIILALCMFALEIIATISLNSQMSNSYAQVNILSYYSTGFWVYNFGLLLTVIGCTIHLQNNSKVAYCDLPAGDRATNPQQAIATIQATLLMHTREAFPVDWAMTQNNLGLAYSDLPTGDHATNLQQAIACYQAALQVYTAETFPVDWAMTQNNLGAAYSDLFAGDRATNLQQAIACYQAALQVRTCEAFPVDWAMTQNNLGLAYSDLLTGDHATNLQQAIACYQAALQVFHSNDMDYYSEVVSKNLEAVKEELQRLKEKSQARKKPGVS